jgi:hypothetical protein
MVEVVVNGIEGGSGKILILLLLFEGNIPLLSNL